MAIDFTFRKAAVRKLTQRVGVYVLCDLDGVPIYVGQSTAGIRSRVARHLTSARSDIIANRQIDVWEIAYVWAYPVEDSANISKLESVLFHHFNPKSALMNGTIVRPPPEGFIVPDPEQKIQVMSDQEIAEKKDPEQRLPRQAAHYAQIVGHFLAVKKSRQVARAMHAHFKRLERYHSDMVASDVEEEKGEDEQI